mmetsp:Transcript_8611/g.28762  ORF Transcript_8611/g.28762 Transcript_8611/m.28762 type:complete len:241 (-) Transcript_8611:400-1122(-)
MSNPSPKKLVALGDPTHTGAMSSAVFKDATVALDGKKGVDTFVAASCKLTASTYAALGNAWPPSSSATMYTSYSVFGVRMGHFWHCGASVIEAPPETSAGKWLWIGSLSPIPVKPLHAVVSVKSVAIVTVAFVFATACSNAPHATTVRAAPTIPPLRFLTSSAVIPDDSPFSTTTKYVTPTSLSATVRSKLCASTAEMAPALVYCPTNLGGVVSGVVKATETMTLAKLGGVAPSCAATWT